MAFNNGLAVFTRSKRNANKIRKKQIVDRKNNESTANEINSPCNKISIYTMFVNLKELQF